MSAQPLSDRYFASVELTTDCGASAYVPKWDERAVCLSMGGDLTVQITMTADAAREFSALLAAAADRCTS